MFFVKQQLNASFTKWSLGGLVVWFGILGMPPRWWWPVDGDDLRLLLYESPHYLARAQGKRGYAGAMCPKNIQKYHPGLQYQGLSSFCYQVVDLKSKNDGFSILSCWFATWGRLDFFDEESSVFLEFVTLTHQLRSPKGGTSRWVKWAVVDGHNSRPLKQPKVLVSLKRQIPFVKVSVN